MWTWIYLEALRAAEEEYRESRQRMRVLRRNIRRNTELFDATESEFIKLYRLPQHAVKTLVEEIRDGMPVSGRRSAISVETKVLAALRFFATGSYQTAVGNDASLGISQTSTSRSIHEVCAAVMARLTPRLIKFPCDQQVRDQIKQRFSEATGFPGVIGAVDCTHISILRPAEDTYINEKGHPTINVQAVCDYDMRILGINARFPGSAGDAYIWQNSAIKTELVRRYAANERDEYLLGDSGYKSEPWLVPPILNAVPGSPEAHFNDMHCKTRQCIERCFELLKSRFRCLLQRRTLHYSPEMAAKIISTCATLHNFAIDLQLPNPEPLQAAELAQEEALDAGDVLPEGDFLPDGDILAEGQLVRDALVDKLWQGRIV